MVTRHLFEKELSDLHSRIIRMGVAVENAISDAITALVEQDGELAQQTIDFDDTIDRMEYEIEEMCLEIIARQQPVARDLRDVTSALKLITDLERIADHAGDISQKVLILSRMNGVMIHHDMIAMADIAKEMIRGSLDSYITRNAELAREIIARDDRVDDLYEKMKNELTRLMAVDPAKIGQYVEMLLICKYIERIADHAENVAEWVVFSVLGEHKANGQGG